MKKLFHLVQWAFVAALVLFAFRMMTHPVPPPDRQPETWASWDGFYALSVAGVSRAPTADYLTREQLAEHLAALERAGYHTIFPEDALAFLEGRHPLPARAVLLMFEGGRKDSFIHTTPELRKAGAVATLAVPTRMVESWSRFYLRPRDLRKITREPHWRLASMGHRAIETRSTANGQTLRYLSSRTEETETDEAYQARVRADFAKARQYLAGAGAPEPVAYLLPYADQGTGPGADPLAAAAIAEGLATHPMAFTRADEIFNGPGSNPRQLSRVRISGTWDSDRLLAALQASEPRLSGVEGFQDPRAWTGGGDVENDRLTLSAGMQAWVRGSESWSDQVVSFTARPGAGGSVSLYVRHMNASRYLRLRVSTDGLSVQEKLGTQAQTLFSSTNPAPPFSRLAVRVRGPRAWVSINDTLVAGPLPLTRGTHQGRVGLEAEGAPAVITHFSAQPRTGYVALSGRGYAALSAEQRTEVSMVVSPWFDTGRPLQVTDEQRTDLLTAAAEGVELVPVLHGGEVLDEAAAAARVAELDHALDHLITRPLVRRIAVEETAPRLADALRQKGYGVIRLVNAETVRAWDDHEQARRAGDAWIILQADETLATTPERWIKLAPARQLAVQVAEHVELPPGVRRAVHVE